MLPWKYLNYYLYFMKCYCSMKDSKDAGLLALRIALGLVFAVHGYMKLTGIEATTGFFDMINVPLPGLMAWVVALIEFVGGLMMILGVYAKTAGALTAFVMVMALLTVHLGKPWAGAELAILALGGSIAIATNGAGKWRLLKKSECACGSCGMCDSSEKHSH